MKITNTSILLPVLLASLVIGCDDHHDDHGVNPAEDGCEHMLEGPEEEVTSSATAEGAPSISAPHRRYDIALTAGEGFVSFDADEAAEFYFFLNEQIDLVVLNSADQSVAAEEENSAVGECTEVASAYVFDLEAGSYTLHFTNGGNEIQVVAFENAEHDHDH